MVILRGVVEEEVERGKSPVHTEKRRRIVRGWALWCCVEEAVGGNALPTQTKEKGWKGVVRRGAVGEEAGEEKVLPAQRKEERGWVSWCLAWQTEEAEEEIQADRYLRKKAAAAGRQIVPQTNNAAGRQLIWYTDDAADEAVDMAH